MLLALTAQCLSENLKAEMSIDLIGTPDRAPYRRGKDIEERCPNRVDIYVILVSVSHAPVPVTQPAPAVAHRSQRPAGGAAVGVAAAAATSCLCLPPAASQWWLSAGYGDKA